jgi:hypothetical protein
MEITGAADASVGVGPRQALRRRVTVIAIACDKARPTLAELVADGAQAACLIGVCLLTKPSMALIAAAAR